MLDQQMHKRAMPVQSGFKFALYPQDPTPDFFDELRICFEELGRRPIHDQTSAFESLYEKFGDISGKDENFIVDGGCLPGR